MIPIGTDNPLSKRPIANYVLIFLNVVVFVFTKQYLDQPMGSDLDQYMLTPGNVHWYQFITYAFLHANWAHVLGNMLFLYIFGANVNDRLGNAGYVFLYLGGAVFSGIGHFLTSGNPVLGASGAVAAVTGAYMILFPLTNIHVLIIFVFITTATIPAIYFILFKLVVFDNMIGPKLGGAGNVAHNAHLAGYLYGVIVPMVLLWLRLIPHSMYDAWALVQRYRRRTEYRRAARQSGSPFGTTGWRRRVDSVVEKQEFPADHQRTDPEIAALRSGISQALAQSDLAQGADLYEKLIGKDPDQVLPQQQQLDVANKLMQTARHELAAGAYEAFLSRYLRYPFIAQVELMLGLLYSRHLNKPRAAREHLKKAGEGLSDPNQKKNVSR